MRPAVLLFLVAGCGPFQWLAATKHASEELKSARERNAEKLAPYEYTIASEYLAKAEELGGYARYQQAVALARRSGELAKKASEVAGEKSDRPREERNE